MTRNNAPWYIKYAAKRPADEIITANNEGNPYLHRWHLIPKNRFLNIYLHRFVGPDQRVMHDHPWISLAYHLKGSFFERYAKSPEHRVKTRTISVGDWTYRGSTFLHYLLPPSTGAWTVFITGPKIRGWGFLTQGGWHPWREVVFNPPKSERRDY